MRRRTMPTNVFCSTCSKKHKSRIDCSIYREWKQKFNKEEIMLAQKCNYSPGTADGHSVLILNGQVYGDKSSLNKYFITQEIAGIVQ
jgi:hypothetical protein